MYEESKPSNTPMTTRHRLTMIGSIQYWIHLSTGQLWELLSISPSPDQNSVIMLTRYVSTCIHVPQEAHWRATKCILWYLTGIADLGLCFKHENPNELYIIAFADANWGFDLNDRKSTFWYYVFLAPLLCHGKKKKKLYHLKVNL